MMNIIKVCCNNIIDKSQTKVGLVEWELVQHPFK